jgi:hypothetical protein
MGQMAHGQENAKSGSLDEWGRCGGAWGEDAHRSQFWPTAVLARPHSLLSETRRCDPPAPRESKSVRGVTPGLGEGRRPRVLRPPGLGRHLLDRNTCVSDFADPRASWARGAARQGEGKRPRRDLSEVNRIEAGGRGTSTCASDATTSNVAPDIGRYELAPKLVRPTSQTASDSRRAAGARVLLSTVR